jgi:Zn-dependent protease
MAEEKVPASRRRGLPGRGRGLCAGVFDRRAFVAPHAWVVNEPFPRRRHSAGGAFFFLLLLAVNAFDGWAEAGWPGLWWNSAVLVAFFACVVLHELGHCFTAMRYGITVPRILLLPIGGMAEFDGIPRQPRRETPDHPRRARGQFRHRGAALAGAAAGAGAAEDNAPRQFQRCGNPPTCCMTWNLAMGLFNLLPAFPMDGGRILRAALATRMDYLRATFWAATTGKVIAGVGAVVAVFYQPLLAALFVFIFVVGELEYRAARRREVEEHHLRLVLARLRAPLPEPPAAGEPPILLR